MAALRSLEEQLSARPPLRLGHAIANHASATYAPDTRFDTLPDGQSIITSFSIYTCIKKDVFLASTRVVFWMSCRCDVSDALHALCLCR